MKEHERKVTLKSLVYMIKNLLYILYVHISLMFLLAYRVYVYLCMYIDNNVKPSQILKVSQSSC